MTIPDSVTSIGDYAFYGCSSLTVVYYTGSGQQWEKIIIGNGNGALKSEAIQYNYSDTIVFNKEANSITVKSTKVIPQAELLVVLFKDERFVGMQSQPIDIPMGEKTFESPITNYTGSDTVKIMIWDSITGMKPLFKSCPGD